VGPFVVTLLHELEN